MTQRHLISVCYISYWSRGRISNDYFEWPRSNVRGGNFTYRVEVISAQLLLWEIIFRSFFYPKRIRAGSLLQQRSQSVTLLYRWIANHVHCFLSQLNSLVLSTRNNRELSQDNTKEVHRSYRATFTKEARTELKRPLQFPPSF